jgi:hypothetical protein
MHFQYRYILIVHNFSEVIGPITIIYDTTIGCDVWSTIVFSDEWYPLDTVDVW